MNNGTLINGPTYVTAASGFGKALSLVSASSQKVSIPAGPLDHAGGSSWCETIRIKSSSNSGVQVCKSSAGGWWIGHSSGNAAFALVGIAAGAAQVSSVNICDGAWHHLELNVDTSGGKLYVDGTLAVSASGTYAPSAFTGATIGNYNGSFYFNGQVDEAASFTTVQHTANFTAPAAPYANNTANLTALYHLDGNAYDWTMSSSLKPIAVNDAGLFFSPYNWVVTGSASAQTTDCGAYLKFSFTGTSVNLTVDPTVMDNAAIGSGTYPRLRCRVDNGVWSDIQMASGMTTIAVGSSLAAGSHTMELHVLNTPTGSDAWNTPTVSILLLGMQIDSSGSTSAPALRPQRMIIFGDSITEGLNITAATQAGQDATISFANTIAAARNAEFGIVGKATQGWAWAGLRNVPAFPSAWNFNWSGQSRSFSPTPDIAVVVHGANDGNNSVADATVQAAVTAWISSFRASASTTKLFVVVPFGQWKASAISAGVAAAADAGTCLVNLGTEIAQGLSGPAGTPSWRAPFDSIHPDARSHAEAATRLDSAMQNILAGRPRRAL